MGLFGKKDAARAVYREKNNAWYNYKRAVAAQKKLEYEEEKKRREEEMEAWLKAKEEEEAKKAALVTPVVDDPFAGFKAISKKDEDSEYFGKGKGRKKRDRTKKKEEKAVAGPFTLNVDTFEQFSLIGLTPPGNVDQVAKSVEDLKARKIWYSEQPRGSIPTATEIRRANEKAAAKLKNSTKENSASSDNAKGKTKKDKFSLP